MLKKILNITALFLALVFLAVSALVLGFKAFVPEAKLIRLAKDGIRGFLSREASLGSLRWGFSGMEIKHFALSEFPNFSKGTFITADSIAVNLNFPPGSNSATVMVDSPRVFITLLTSGVWNFSDISYSYFRTKNPENQRRRAYFPFFSKLSITGGEITIRDRKSGTRGKAVKNISFKGASDPAFTVFNAKLSASVINGGDTLDVSSDLSIYMKSGEVEIKELRITMAGKMIIISGLLGKGIFAGDEPEFNFNVSGDRAVLDSVLELLSDRPGTQYGMKATANLNITGGKGKLTVTEKNEQ